jgi:RHS repeat-associated protein
MFSHTFQNISILNTCTGFILHSFNGKENDNEVYSGTGTFQDYGMRMYDTRVARFISVDPITREYPELTPFQFASNTPINSIDLDGKESKTSYSWSVEQAKNVILITKGMETVLCAFFSAMFVPADAISYDHYAGNTKDPALKKEYQEKAKAAYAETLINGLIGYGIGKIAGTVGNFISKYVKTVSTFEASEINSQFILKGLKAPYSTGTKIVETTLQEDIKLIRVSGENNVSGDWYTNAETIKDLTPAQIKSVLGLKYEPTKITEVILEKGAKVRIGKAAEIKDWNANGGGLQIEKLEGNAKYGETKDLVQPTVKKVSNE